MFCLSPGISLPLENHLETVDWFVQCLYSRSFYHENLLEHVAHLCGGSTERWTHQKLTVGYRALMDEIHGTNFIPLQDSNPKIQFHHLHLVAECPVLKYTIKYIYKNHQIALFGDPYA